MTNLSKMVIVTKWTHENVEALLLRITEGTPESGKDRKRRRIIEAAESLFIAQGYRKTSIDEVARRAGVSKGTVYLYAKSKAELLMQALALEKLKQRHLIAHVMDESVSARERLRRYIEVAFVGSVKSPLYSKVLNGDMDVVMALNEVSPVPAEKATDLGTAFIEQLLAEIAGDSLGKEEIKDRAKALLILIFFSAKLGDQRVRQGLSVERAAQLIADMIVDDIAAQPRSTVHE